MLIRQQNQSYFAVVPIPFLISAILVLLPLVFLNHARAQSITSDGSMGTQVSIDNSNYTISEGTIRGSNQFHSFGKFNVFEGESATFTGPAAINNIIGRVTGGNQSLIDGLLKSDIDGANLFLLNPNGVLFGENAQLDVSGSFHVSTADFLRLGDDGVFYASLSENSTLSIDPPSAFGFLSGNPSSITTHARLLEVPAGETLSMVGGDIEISGDESANFGSARVVAAGGKLNLVSVRSNGEIVFPEAGEASGINLDAFRNFGEISISKGALASTSGESGGTVVIRGGRLTVDQGYVFSDTGGNINGSSIGVDILLAEYLSIVNGGQIASNSYGGGTAGDIYIRSGSATLAGIPQFRPSLIASHAYSVGDSGNVYIETSELEMRDAAFISASSYFSTGANAGNVEIIAENIFLSGPESSPDPFVTDFTGFWTSPGWYGGDGGDLRVVSDNLTMINRSQLDSSAYGAGHGGDLEVISDNIQILSGSNIIASAFGSGDGGICNITADHLLLSGVSPEIFTDITGHQSLSPSGIASQTGLNGGSAGGVNIRANKLEIYDGARIGVETFGPGDGGTVDIDADNINISGVNEELSKLLSDAGADPKYAAASILAAAYSIYSGDNATGNGGNLTIKANTISLSEGALITSETEAPGDGGFIEIFGENVTLESGASIAASSTLSWASTVGKAGDISIKANNRFMSDNSSVTTAADQAQGGNINISAQNVQLKNKALISAESSGAGNAGNISIVASATINSDKSSITTTAEQAVGGDIALTAKKVRLTSGAVTSTESSGEGNAGNININASDLFWLDNSTVSTDAKEADGGNIKVNTQDTVSLWDSEITASVGGGPDTVGGNIGIDPDFVTLSNSSIIANAFEGRGGNIQITAGVFLADAESVVEASSQLGIDGTVDIRSPNKVVAQSVKPLSDEYQSAVTLLREPCVARLSGGKYSSFVVSGRDALPIQPGGLLPSPIKP